MNNIGLQSVSGAALAAAVVVTAVLTGCASVGAPSGSDGAHNGSSKNQDGVSFPSPDDSYLKTGAFTGPDHVRRVQLGAASDKAPGMNRDQVRLELGNPHFGEGINNPKVWNYVFNFYTGQANAYVTCQFQVHYNDDYRVQSTHWNLPQCAQWVAPPVEAQVVVPVVPVVPAPVLPVVPAPQRLTLSSDGMFAFGKSGLQDLQPAGQRNLAQLATQLKTGFKSITSIIVAGHTDRIGSASDNQALSLARAQTVRDYLVQSGIDSKLIRAVGMGATQPRAQCEGARVTPALVACLQPSRRVEVEVVGQN